MDVLVEPGYEQVLEFCERDPIERVFLEDVARRGLGRFWALEDGHGGLQSLCHVGANLVPSGERCGVFGDAAASSGSRMSSRWERPRISSAVCRASSIAVSMASL